jgi:hypothetical protein
MLKELKLEEFTPVDSISSSGVYFGRVLCDSVTGIDKLNKKVRNPLISRVRVFYWREWVKMEVQM